MKKILLIVFTGIIFFSLAGLVSAVDKVKVKQIAGEVAAVDAMANSMTVKGKMAEKVMTTDEKTVVKAEKKISSLSEIKIGDKVTVKYHEIGSNNIATSIEVKPKPEKSSAKTKEPSQPLKK